MKRRIAFFIDTRIPRGNILQCSHFLIPPEWNARNTICSNEYHRPGIYSVRKSKLEQKRHENIVYYDAMTSRSRLGFVWGAVAAHLLPKKQYQSLPETRNELQIFCKRIVVWWMELERPISSLSSIIKQPEITHTQSYKDSNPAILLLLFFYVVYVRA